MNSIKRNPLVKVVSIVVIITFLALDVSWAYPTKAPVTGQKLSGELAFQPNLMGEQRETFQQSLFADAKILLSVNSIAKFLLEDELPVDKLAYVLREELGEIGEGINLSGVRLRMDGVILIPHEAGGKKQIIQIAKKDNLSIKELAGYQWVANDKYVIKVLPEDYKETPAQAETEKEPEVKISEPIAEIEEEIETPLAGEKGTSRIKIVIKAISVVGAALVLILITPLSALAGTGEAFTWPSYVFIGVFTVACLSIIILWRLTKTPLWNMWRLGSKNYRVRDRAVEKLAKIGKPVVGLLIGALKHENGRVRSLAARALGLIGSAEATDPLLNLLRGNKEAYYSAVTALAAIGDKKAVNPLVKTLGKCPLVEIPGVTKLIEEYADESSVEHLAVRLTQLTSRDFDAKRFIIEMLKKIGDKRATSSLSDLIKREDELATTRQRAAEALLGIGDPGLLKKEFGDDYRAVLKAHTLIYNEGLSVESQEKMIEIGKPAVPVLLFYLSKGNPSIVGALGGIKDERAVEPMINILRTRQKKDFFEQCIMGALANIGDMRAFEVLVERMEDAFKHGWPHILRGSPSTYALVQGGHHRVLAELNYTNAVILAFSTFIPVVLEKGEPEDRELLKKSLRTVIGFELDSHTNKNGSTRRYQEGKLIRLSDQDYEKIISELVNLAMQTGSVESVLNVMKEAVEIDFKGDRTIKEAEGYWEGTGRDAPFGYDKTVEEKEWVETSPAVIEYGHLHLRVDWEKFEKLIQDEKAKPSDRTTDEGKPESPDIARETEDTKEAVIQACHAIESTRNDFLEALRDNKADDEEAEETTEKEEEDDETDTQEVTQAEEAFVEAVQDARELLERLETEDAPNIVELQKMVDEAVSDARGLIENGDWPEEILTEGEEINMIRKDEGDEERERMVEEARDKVDKALAAIEPAATNCISNMEPDGDVPEDVRSAFESARDEARRAVDEAVSDHILGAIDWIEEVENAITKAEDRIGEEEDKREDSEEDDEEGEEPEEDDAHEFKAGDGFFAAGVTTVLSVEGVVGAVVLFLLSGPIAGAIGAISAGVYFGCASVKYYFVGRATYKAMRAEGFSRGEATNKAIAETTGYVHDAFKKPEFSPYAEKAITLHEGFKSHFWGMVTMLPLLGYLFPGRYEESMRKQLAYSRLMGDIEAQNVNGLYRGMLSDIPVAKKLAEDTVTSMTDVDKLVKLATEFKDLWARKLAIRRLAKLKDPKAAVPLFKKLLSASDGELREEATVALKAIDTLEAKVFFMLSTGDVEGIIALSKKEDVIPALLIGLRNRATAGVLPTALKVLRQIRMTPRVIETLINLVERENDSTVRKLAIEMLGESRDPRAKTPLIKSLTLRAKDAANVSVTLNALFKINGSEGAKGFIRELAAFIRGRLDHHTLKNGSIVVLDSRARKEMGTLPEAVYDTIISRLVDFSIKAGSVNAVSEIIKESVIVDYKQSRISFGEEQLEDSGHGLVEYGRRYWKPAPPIRVKTSPDVYHPGHFRLEFDSARFEIMVTIALQDSIPRGPVEEIAPAALPTEPGVAWDLVELRGPVEEIEHPLFLELESYINNARDMLVDEANKLIDFMNERVEIKETLIINTGSTAEIMGQMKKAIAYVKELQATPGVKVPKEIAEIAESVEKDLDLFEAEGTVSALILLARKAERKGKNLVIGIETDWIPGFEGGKLQHNAISALISEINSLQEKLRSMGLKNLTIIHKKGDELAGAIIDETLEAEEDVSTADLSNVVVLASKETIDSEVFNLFRSDIKTKRAFLAAVDSSELKEAYAEHGETFDKQLDAKISEMLCLTLELAAGKTAPISDVPWLEIEYDEVLRIVTFLPRAKPIDYDKLQERYDRKKLALQAV